MTDKAQPVQIDTLKTVLQSDDLKQVYNICRAVEEYFNSRAVEHAKNVLKATPSDSFTRFTRHLGKAFNREGVTEQETQEIIEEQILDAQRIQGLCEDYKKNTHELQTQRAAFLEVLDENILERGQALTAQFNDLLGQGNIAEFMVAYEEGRVSLSAVNDTRKRLSQQQEDAQSTVDMYSRVVDQSNKQIALLQQMKP